MRTRVRLNLRLLVRPLLRAWRQTKLSVRCRKRYPICFLRQSLHWRHVWTAFISKMLMWCWENFQLQPAISFQRHNLAGTLARRRWYLTVFSVSACKSKSSPLVLTSPASCLISCPWVCGEPPLRNWRTGSLLRNPWRLVAFPGVQLSTTSCKVMGLPKPKGLVSWERSKATTCTHHVFPKSDSLRSVYSAPFCCCFGTQGAVYPAGNPKMTSRSRTDGSRISPSFWSRWQSLYWYGGKRCSSSSHRETSWGRHVRSPAGRFPGCVVGRAVAKVGSPAQGSTTVHPGLRKSCCSKDALKRMWPMSVHSCVLGGSTSHPGSGQISHEHQ